MQRVYSVVFIVIKIPSNLSSQVSQLLFKSDIEIVNELPWEKFNVKRSERQVKEESSEIPQVNIRKPK